MPNIHPLIVHFPIVLLYLSVGLEALYLFRRRDYIQKSATLTLYLGTLSLGVAAFTGWLAHKTVAHSEWSFPIIEKHELLGFIALGCFVGLCLLKQYVVFKNRPKNLRVIYGVLSIVSLTILTLGAHFGGVLVFEYGVGVKGVDQAPKQLVEKPHHNNDHHHH
jgi:uncharacterized membrane protein